MVQTTRFRYDPAGIRTTVINPDGSKLIQPFPHYEEQRAANGNLLNQRTSYTLGGQLIALEQDGTLYYAHTDHLGSPTALMQKQGEVFVSSSIARYKPYGGYLTQPTACYANSKRPRAAGIGRPSACAVSIHSSITTSRLASTSA